MALALSSLETPTWMFWDCCPQLPCHSPAPTPLLLRRAGFGGSQPVNPSPIPPGTLGSTPAPAASPYIPPIPYYLPVIGFVCQYSIRLEWMTEHTHVFLDIYPQSHPVEDYRHCIKRGLEPPQVGGGHHTVVRIEERCLKVQPLMSLLRLPLSAIDSPNRHACRLFRVVIVSAYYNLQGDVSIYGKCIEMGKKIAGACYISLLRKNTSGTNIHLTGKKGQWLCKRVQGFIINWKLILIKTIQALQHTYLLVNRLDNCVSVIHFYDLIMIVI